ncbi:MAG: ribosome modulation factor [Gammaproteobacteria bacterium]
MLLRFEFYIFINYSLNVDFTNATQYTNKKVRILPMKRQKRDRLERAHSQGFKAGLAGRSKELCPYQQVDPKSEWLGGWREAIENRNMYKT